MSESETDQLPDASEPTLVHWYGPISIVTKVGRSGWADGIVTVYGQETVLTPELRRINEDRNGNSIFDLLDDEPTQIEKWGKVMLARGPWPEGVPRIEPDSQDWLDAAVAARATAWAIPGRQERDQALAEVTKEWGQPATVSRTLQTYPPSEKP
ncbi:MAG: hypothetical protein QOI54_3317 [Actinomycetota bacterium]|jgi:hypothetical protein|nr:hypothetical protein [Actinomycetota bacterium]